MTKPIRALLRPRVFSIWVQDIEPASYLETPGLIVTADPSVIRGVWPHVAAWLSHVPTIEFHCDPRRGWPFQSDGLGVWRVAGCPAFMDPIETSRDGPDRIEAAYACMYTLAKREGFPRIAWELAADRTHGVLSVAIAAATGRSLALGTAQSYGPAGLACGNQHGVSLSSRTLPTKKGRTHHAN